MTNKGKHSSQTPATFYRDLTIMILGIVAVGALVFFVLYLFADQPITGPTTTTTTIEATTTSASGSTVTSDQTTSTTPGSTSSTGVAVRPNSEVTVIVLNSIGIDGAAGRLTSELAADGYQTLTPDDYEPEQDPSRIWYRDGFAAEASVLVDTVEGALVEPLPDESIGEGADIVIVLGTGYTE